MAIRKTGFAAKTKPQPITSWSFSRYNDYQKCPLFFKLKNIEKMVEGTENKNMYRGTVLHRFGELYILNKPLSYDNMVDEKGKQLCTEDEYHELLKEWRGILKEFKDEFDELRDAGAQTELMITFTKDWAAETRWNDWKGAWVRIKVDAMHKPDPAVVSLIDLKSGKIYDSNREQIGLYAIAGFLLNPEAKTVSGELWYLDQGEIIQEEYQRKSLPVLQKDWAKKTKAMLTDTSYKPKPNNSCRWCPYSKSKGGPCEY